MAGALERLPPGLPARVWLEVPRTEDRQALNTAAKARISWLVRNEGAACGVEAVRAAEPPGGTPYAWIAGEASGVRALHHHLVRERGFAPARVTSAAYWWRGLSAEQAREAKAEAKEKAEAKAKAKEEAEAEAEAKVEAETATKAQAAAFHEAKASAGRKGVGASS